MSRPNTRYISGAVAAGNGSEHDAWDDHKEEFKDLNINDRDGFREHINTTMNNDSTVVLEANKDATIYYDKNTNTAVVHDPRRPDQGTCFRPETPNYMEKKEREHQINLGREPLKVEGGHDAYYDAKEQRDTNAKQQSAAPSQEQTPAEQPAPQTTEPAAKQEPSSFRERMQAKQEAAEIKKVEPPPEPAPSQGLSR